MEDNKGSKKLWRHKAKVLYPPPKSMELSAKKGEGSLALRDIFHSLLKYRIWGQLGLVEIKQRYRRSVLGPWWITVSMAIFVMAMGAVFSKLFQEGLENYVPFFTAGFLFWSFISASVIESADIFRSSAPFITQTQLPLSLYVFKHLVRQLICLGHNFVIYLIVCLIFQKNPGVNFLLLFPGFLLLSLNVFWVSFVVAIVCTRFRDMVPIISSCMQIAFFVTPISWMPKLSEQYPAILRYNPLVYLLDLVRSPALGQMPEKKSVLVATWLAAIGLAFAFFLFSKTRSRIAYWVD